jgi:lipoprotein-anchoring transpeptidase ErfK/SrfK
MIYSMQLLRVTIVRLVVLLVAATVACAAAPAADNPAVPIARGVRVGDVVLTGLTAQLARERLRSELERPLDVRAGTKTFSVHVERFRVSADVDAAVRASLHAGPGAAIALHAKADEQAIDRTVAKLARRFYRPARDATVVGLDARLRPVLGPPASGRKLDRRAAARTIRKALARGLRYDIRLRFRRVPPAVTLDGIGAVIVIRRASNMLTLYEGRKRARVFRVATGQASYPTPLGRFEVVDRQYNPWWYPPTSDWAAGLKPVPPGSGNPLGTRWLGLSAWGVGIHGTPDAASIGYSASHGCIRMYVPDAEWLFERVAVATPVFIVSS